MYSSVCPRWIHCHIGQTEKDMEGDGGEEEEEEEEVEEERQRERERKRPDSERMRPQQRKTLAKFDKTLTLYSGRRKLFDKI
jgi:hypothetical protein